MFLESLKVLARAHGVDGGSTRARRREVLARRLRYLLIEEGYGAFTICLKPDTPKLGLAVSIRYAVELGEADLRKIARDMPELGACPVWPLLLKKARAQGTAERAAWGLADTVPEAPMEDDPSRIRLHTRQCLRRLAYLLEHEFAEAPAELLLPSAAYRALRSPGRGPHVLEAWLGARRAIERKVARIGLAAAGIVPSAMTEADLRTSVAERLAHRPELIAGATSEQLAQFEAAGLLTLAFGLRQRSNLMSTPEATEPSAGFPEARDRRPSSHSTRECAAEQPRTALPKPGGSAWSRFSLVKTFPGGGDAHRHLGKELSDQGPQPVLITTMRADRGFGEDDFSDLPLPYEGIVELRFFGRVTLPDGDSAYALVEAIPAARQSIRDVPLAPEEALSRTEEVAAILSRVHEAGRVVLGLRPELVFVHDHRELEIAPRGTLLRRRIWWEAPRAPSNAPSFEDFYVAPEILRGFEPTPESDTYSLGLCLAYWLTGSHALARHCLLSQSVVEGDLGFSGIPKPIRSLLNRLVARKIRSRPSPKEAQALLRASREEILEDRPTRLLQALPPVPARALPNRGQ